MWWTKHHFKSSELRSMTGGQMFNNKNPCLGSQLWNFIKLSGRELPFSWNIKLKYEIYLSFHPLSTERGFFSVNVCLSTIKLATVFLNWHRTVIVNLGNMSVNGDGFSFTKSMKLCTSFTLGRVSVSFVSDS